MSIKKKLKNTVKNASDEIKTEQIKFYFTRKDIRPVQNKARSQLDKKGKKKQQS